MTTPNNHKPTTNIRSGLPVTSTTWVAQELAEWGWSVIRVADLELYADAPHPHDLSVYVEYPHHSPAVIGFLWQGGHHPMTRLRQIVAQANEGNFGPGRPPGTPGQVSIEEWPIVRVTFDPSVHPGWLADLIAAATEPEQS